MTGCNPVLPEAIVRLRMFQSTAGPMTGCNNRPGKGADVPTRFNPQPAP